MKKNFIYIVAAILFMSTGGWAQEYGYAHLPRIVSSEVEKAGEQLNVNCVLDYNQMDLTTNDELVITPLIVSGTDTMELEPIIFIGNAKRKLYDRHALLYGNSAIEGAYGDLTMQQRSDMTEAGKRLWMNQPVNSTKTVSYQRTVAYQPWMGNSEVMLKEEISGCDGHYVEHMAPLGNVLYNPVVARVVFITPEYENRRIVRDNMTAYVNFEQGKHRIVPTLDNNDYELHRIIGFTESIMTTEDVEVQAIHIKGYASPEGSYALNTQLSGDRVAALRDYLQQYFGASIKAVHVDNVPEDWDSLRTWVASSDLKDRREVLEIIDNTADPDERNARIQKLGDGSTYRMLLRDVYPSLRRVDYGVEYQTIPYTTERGMELLRKTPHELTLNDMYILMVSYPYQSSECEEVHVVASRFFPEDAIVNNNMAAYALYKREPDRAKDHLMRSADHPDCQNNLGVLAVIEGDKVKAAEYFQKAAAAGSSEAEYNLAHLDDLIY